MINQEDKNKRRRTEIDRGVLIKFGEIGEIKDIDTKKITHESGDGPGKDDDKETNESIGEFVFGGLNSGFVTTGGNVGETSQDKIDEGSEAGNDKHNLNGAGD